MEKGQYNLFLRIKKVFTILEKIRKTRYNPWTSEIVHKRHDPTQPLLNNVIQKQGGERIVERVEVNSIQRF